MSKTQKVLKISVPQIKVILKETKYDGINYVCPTWDQMGLLNFDLASQIIKSGKKFDRVVALARGGWTWARDIAGHLDIPELSSFRIKSYSNVNESEKPIIAQPLTDSIVNERVLLFDEVVDSGATVKLALEYLKIMGAKNVQTAALCYKPHAKIKPDFFAFETLAWVVFPHENREFIESSCVKWKAQGLSIKEIKNRLLTIGLPLKQIEFYCKEII
jgi:uncharacterized protein